MAVIFMTLLLLIGLAVAAPRIAAGIQRDRETELVRRGEQYKRAIKLYYKKFGRYPGSIDQLESSNNIHFLRKRYADPMTGKDDWKLIHLGEAHVKPMGLFSQPIQNGGATTTAGNTGMVGTTPTFGGMSNGSTFSSSSSSTDSSGTSSTFGNGTTPGGSSTSSFGGTSPSSPSSGQTMGGAPIVGVASKNTKTSIRQYKLQKHYNEWEFVYDPVEDLMSAVSLFGGASTNVNGNNGTNGTGSSSPTSPGSNPTAPSSGFPSSTPPSPQQ